MSTEPVKKTADKWATWIQLPRRIVLLLLAFGLALLFIRALRQPLRAGAPQSLRTVDWTVSWASKGQAVSDLIENRRANTLSLLGAALVVALLFTLIQTLIGVLVHKLEEKTGPVGSIVKGLGRLWVFGSSTVPIFAASVVLIQIFAVSLKVLPVGGMITLGASGGGLGDRIKHLLMPALLLSLLPAAITAQVLARATTLARDQHSPRSWLGALFTGLGVLLGQIGGLAAMTILIEPTFSWPGIGRLGVDALFRRDFPVALGVLESYVRLVLIGQLFSALFRWLARLTSSAPVSPQPEPTRWRKTARIAWTVICILFLLLPLAFAAAGLLTGSERTTRQDMTARLDSPSAEHPFGTDRIGRDIAARVWRGGLVTLGMAALAVVLIVVPCAIWGVLSGVLRATGSWWGESLADLMLLPLDALRLLPSVLAAAVIALVINQLGTTKTSWLGVILACTILLLPRAVRAVQTLWVAAPHRKKWLILGLAGTGALLTGTMFAGLFLSSALGFLGLGIAPPTPTLGNLITFMPPVLSANPLGAIAPVLVLSICSFAFYLAADALIGFFNSKEVMARFNE